MDKLVTVSIASYNNALYIERCIDSVLSQTYKNIEIIIVDDGSRDETMSIIERYKADQRVRIISKENGGLSSVRQLALDRANGEYISFIDADDYLAPQYVERMLNKLITDNADICVCSTRFIDEKENLLNDETQGFSCIESTSPFRTSVKEYENFYRKDFTNIHLSDSWNKMYKTTSLRSFGVKFNMPKGLNGSDTLFNRLVAFHAPRYCSVKDELYIHVIYSKSAVHRKNKNLFLTYKIITEESIRECKNLGIYGQTKSYIISKYYCNLFETLIDNYKDSKGYLNTYKQFKVLKNAHKKFAEENEPSLTGYQGVQDYPSRIGLFMFENITWALPLYFLFGDLVRRL